MYVHVIRGPVEVRRPPFCVHGVRAAGVRIGSVGLDRASPVDCVVNCVPSVCERAQPWSNCHRVYAPQGAPSVRTGCACRKAAGRRAGTHLQGRRMLSRHMHSVAKRPALFQINAFACYLTGALRPPVRMPFQPAHPPARLALRPTRAISLPGGSAGAFRLLCRLAVTPRRSRSRWRSGRWFHQSGRTR